MKNLGRYAEDVITGFKGVITSKVSYLTGCDQYGMTPQKTEDNKIEGTQYFDVNRIKLLGGGIELPKVESSRPLAAVGGPNRDNPSR